MFGCGNLRRRAIIQLFLISSSSYPMIFHAREFSAPARDRTQMLHGKIETNIAIKFPVSRISWITLVRAPDLPTCVRVSRKRRWPRRRITRRIDRTTRTRFSEQQAVCIQNEPANIRFLEDCFQARRVRTFWQPKSARLRTEEIDIHIAADQNLCTRRWM